jgi:NTP pyrophosphatase (non-canonical NTP hydrolase)
MKLNQIYEKAVEHSGLRAQLLMLVEELGELQQAVLKSIREENGAVTTAIIEEWADVRIMMEQMEEYWVYKAGVDFDEEVEKVQLKKILRLNRRLEKDELHSASE